MIIRKSDELDFKATFSMKRNNSLNFENIGNVLSISDDPNYKSKLNLVIYDNPILNRYIDSIIDNGILLDIPVDTIYKYYRAPELLSLDHYRVTDYWYLLLRMNGFNSVHEFKDFTKLIGPSIMYVTKIVDEIEYIEKSQKK